MSLFIKRTLSHKGSLVGNLVLQRQFSNGWKCLEGPGSADRKTSCYDCFPASKYICSVVRYVGKCYFLPHLPVLSSPERDNIIIMELASHPPRFCMPPFILSSSQVLQLLKNSEGQHCLNNLPIALSLFPQRNSSLCSSLGMGNETCE